MTTWINRWLETELLDWETSSKKGLLIIGARQTGKSSLLKKLLEKSKDRLPGSLFYNYASPVTLNAHRLDMTEARAEILHTLSETSARKAMLTVFVDEASRHPPIFDLAQELMDEHRGKLRFVLTGSSARRLQKGTYNRLPGRVLMREMWPIGWDEMPKKLLGDVASALCDALVYGMLPEIRVNPKERGEILKAYAGLYVREEIEQENLVRSPESFSRFLRLSAAESGGLVNAAKLAKQLGLKTLKTVQKFNEILETTKIASFLPAFTDRNDRQETISTPKLYWFDNGVRNAVLGRPLAPAILDMEGGLLFEHLLIQEAFKQIAVFSKPENPTRAFYWREHNGKEVDLVLEKGTGELMLFEFKFTDQLEPKHLAGFYKFDEWFSHRRKTRKVAHALVASVARNRLLEKTEVLNVSSYVTRLKEFLCN